VQQGGNKVQLTKENKSLLSKKVEKTVTGELLNLGVLPSNVSNFKITIDAKVHLEADGVVCDFDIKYPEEN
jgi:hypothetical protein